MRQTGIETRSKPGRAKNRKILLLIKNNNNLRLLRKSVCVSVRV